MPLDLLENDQMLALCFDSCILILQPLCSPETDENVRKLCSFRCLSQHEGHTNTQIICVSVEIKIYRSDAFCSCNAIEKSDQISRNDVVEHNIQLMIK